MQLWQLSLYGKSCTVQSYEVLKCLPCRLVELHVHMPELGIADEESYQTSWSQWHEV